MGKNSKPKGETLGGLADLKSLADKLPPGEPEQPLGPDGNPIPYTQGETVFGCITRTFHGSHPAKVLTVKDRPAVQILQRLNSKMYNALVEGSHAEVTIELEGSERNGFTYSGIVTAVHTERLNALKSVQEMIPNTIVLFEGQLHAFMEKNGIGPDQVIDVAQYVSAVTKDGQFYVVNSEMFTAFEAMPAVKANTTNAVKKENTTPVVTKTVPVTTASVSPANTADTKTAKTADDVTTVATAPAAPATPAVATPAAPAATVATATTATVVRRRRRA